MKFGLSIYSLRRTIERENWRVLDFLRFCSRNQIQHVELLDVFWSDFSAEYAPAIDFMRESGISLAYGVSNNFVQKDPAARAKAVEEVRRGIRVVSEQGLSTLRVFAGNPAQDVSYAEAEGYIADCFGQVLPDAEQARVHLALENHGALVGRSEQIVDLIRKLGSSCLVSTFDMGNFLLRGESPLDALRNLFPYIHNVHVKDFRIRDESRGRPLGELDAKAFVATICGRGDVPIPELLRLLRDGGYAGNMALEFEGPEDDQEGVLQGMAYVSQLLGSA